MRSSGRRRDSISRIALRYADDVTPIAPRTVISFITILSETKSGMALNPLVPASTIVPPAFT
jgi:hypothetical protein